MALRRRQRVPKEAPVPEGTHEIEARLFNTLAVMDKLLDDFATEFRERIADGEDYIAVAHDLGHQIIDRPQMWPREALAILALRAASRLPEPRKQG